MSEIKQDGRIGIAALKAGMHRNTARRYLDLNSLPSQTKRPRHWRTRKNPFAEDWPELVLKLEDAPELEAKALFEDLVTRHPGRYEESQLRTLQRHIRQWRAENGPPKEVFFAQSHRAGEAIQTDFTRGDSLRITIEGEEFPHLLGHSVLPFSNWQSVVVVRSESMLALRRTLQTALHRLGYVPEYHQTDNSTAATHALGPGREFNEKYLSLMQILGMKPRTIGIGQSHQNGDVEALNGALKRRLEQHLLLRRHRDFESIEAYEVWVTEVVEKVNRLRSKRLLEEIESMRPWNGNRLPEHRMKRVRVRSRSTIRIHNNTYSVPSRLIGEDVDVWLFEDRLEVTYRGELQLSTPRLLGEGKHRIDYRHIIGSLVKKPGAFRRYCFRESLFPSLSFRQTFDQLSETLTNRQADLEYLRILHLAASTLECEVQAALDLFLDQKLLPRYEEVQILVEGKLKADVPDMPPLTVDLSGYDALLEVNL